MQKAYVTALYEIMKEDPRVCSLLSDSGTDYDLLMAREMPEQCFNFGISEQHKVAAASGMAAMGKIPFVYTTGAFLAYRSFEFIRDDVCFQNRSVKLVGMGTGMGCWSTLGVSHHSTEDISALRALPNLTLLSASTPLQLRRMVRAAYETPGPVYIRMGMSGEAEYYSEDYHYRIGKPDTVIEGGEVMVFTSGLILDEAYKAVRRLNENGAKLGLVDVHTLKPVDGAELLALTEGKRLVFTVEDHSVTGGLGSILAELLAERGRGPALYRIGLRDSFASGYGTKLDVWRVNGLDADGIFSQIKPHL